MIYVRHEAGQLVQMVGCHVDDLKGCDTPDGKYHNELLSVLERHFGALKDKRYSHFECCGVQHDQSDSFKEIETSQDHYLAHFFRFSTPCLVLSRWTSARTRPYTSNSCL